MHKIYLFLREYNIIYMKFLNKYCKNPLKNSLLVLLISFIPVDYCLAGLFGNDDVLWKSGENLYIKLDDQDKSGGKVLPNDHPVKLDQKSITNALMQVEYWEKENASSGDASNMVFATSQARLLGTYLAQGLAVAKPDQDIVFALATLKTIALGIIKEKVFIAGRAFYKDNHLNIIIGDYDYPTDKGKEAAAGGAGVTEIKYFLNEGRRGKPSSFKKTVITGNGIDLQSQGNRKRRDWLVINVPVAAQAYVASIEKKQDNKSTDINTEALQAESEKLAKERREMRAEMARMRKEMEEMSSGDSEASTKSIEERIATLDDLLEKKLITKDEYDKKRKEILGDI